MEIAPLNYVPEIPLRGAIYQSTVCGISQRGSGVSYLGRSKNSAAMCPACLKGCFRVLLSNTQNTAVNFCVMCHATQGGFSEIPLLPFLLQSKYDVPQVTKCRKCTGFQNAQNVTHHVG